MQNAMLKTMTCALIFMMMAVLCGFTTTGHTTEPMTEGETVHDAQEVTQGLSEAVLPSTKPMYSRRSVKRWAHILILRSQNPRRKVRSALISYLSVEARRTRAAVRKVENQRFRAVLGAFFTAPKRKFDEWREARIEPQCADCGVHQDDGFAVDTSIKPVQCVDCFQTTETDGLRAYAPFIVAGICAVVVGLIFEPQTASLLAIGAVRKPMPQWTKDAAKKHGVKIRRHETGRKTVACAACQNGIAPGDIKAMLEASGYTQKKPHCEPCAQKMLDARPEQPTPESTPEPTPEPSDSWPPNRKAGDCAVCGVHVMARVGTVHTDSKRGQKVRCADHTGMSVPEQDSTVPAVENDTSAQISEALNSDSNAQKAKQLMEILSTMGGADEDEIRRIVKEETGIVDGNTIKTIQEFAHGMKNAALEAVDERLKELHQPTIIHISTDGGPAVPANDDGEIIHRQEIEILAKISALTRRNRAQNIMLVGDAGTGKTHMSEGVFKRLRKIGFFKGMEKEAVCHVESCNEEKQPSDLMGRLSPSFFDDGSGTPSGAWKFFAGAVMKAFCSPGVLVFDEMETLAPPSFSALNAMLANGFIVDPDGVKHFRHPRCVVIGTANTRGNGADEDYTASHAQSLASLDRFAAGFVDVDFDPAIEDALAPTIAQDIRDLRVLSKERRCRRVVFSYRVMMNAQALAEDFGKEYALSETVFQFGAENAALLGHSDRVPLPDSPDLGGLAPMNAKDRKDAMKKRNVSFSLQSFNADTLTDADTSGAA